MVKDLSEQGAAYADKLGYVPCSPVIFDPLQKVYLQFWSDGSGSLIELIAPASPDSPVWRESRKGGGLNHLCYEAPDFDRQLDESLRRGGMLTREVSPAVAFGNRRVAFVFFLELGLIEFVEAESPGQPSGKSVPFSSGNPS